MVAVPTPPNMPPPPNMLALDAAPSPNPGLGKTNPGTTHTQKRSEKATVAVLSGGTFGGDFEQRVTHRVPVGLRREVRRFPFGLEPGQNLSSEVWLSHQTQLLRTTVARLELKGIHAGS